MTDELKPVLNKLHESVKEQTKAANRMAKAPEDLTGAAPGTTTLPTDPGGAMPNIMQDTRTGKLGEVSLSEASINALVKGIAAGATMKMMAPGGIPGGGTAAGTVKAGIGYAGELADQSPALNALSTAFANFRKEFLATDFNFDSVTEGIKGSEQALNKLNVSSDKVIIAMQKLKNASPAVRTELMKNGEQGKKNVVQLAAMAAQYEAMGVAPEEFASAIETARSSLGLFTKSGQVNAAELEKLMGKTLALSKAYKTPLGSTIKELTQSFPELAIMGLGPLINNFDKLTNVATQTGVEIGSFMKMSEQFNTLEGAADVVGNLSAVLKGTTVSVGEMLAAEPAERVQAVLGDIRGAIEEGRFELAEGGMERVYQVQALAQAAGVTSEEMNKLLRNTTDVEELFEARAGKAKTTSEEAAKAAADMISAEEKKKSVMTTLANEVVNAKGNFNKFTELVNQNTEVMRTNIGNFGKAIGDLSAVMAGVKTSVEAMSGPEGGAAGGGFFGTLLFGRTDVFKTNMDAVEGVVKRSDDMLKKLVEGFGLYKGILDTEKKDPEKAGGSTWIPENNTNNTTPPAAQNNNQRTQVMPNGDITVTTTQVLPVNILTEAVNKGQTNKL